MNEQVNEKEAIEFANECGGHFQLTSSLQNFGINELFHEINKKIENKKNNDERIKAIKIETEAQRRVKENNSGCKCTPTQNLHFKCCFFCFICCDCCFNINHYLRSRDLNKEKEEIKKQLIAESTDI